MEFGKLNLNTIPPTAPTQDASVVEEVHTETPEVITPSEGTPATPQTTKVEQVQPEVKPDLFFEGFNKRFSTQFKADDELKAVLDTPKKISEYETRLRDYEATKKSAEDYKKEIERLEGSQDPLAYFSSPDAYIAEQLKIKYPKSNPDTLHKIATTDLSKMDDLDVLVKDKQLFVPDAPKESIIRSVVLKKYGIDPTTSSEEWDEISVAEMKLDAAAARDKINNLKSVIEMPKIVSKEEKIKAEAEAKVQREQVLAPIKETLTKFDKFSHKDIEGFSMDVPHEYESKLPDMFRAYVQDSGLEPTPANLQSFTELKEALFVHTYLPKMREIWIKEGETNAQKKYDAESHNDQPPNRTTRSDEENVNTPSGLGQFLADQGIRK